METANCNRMSTRLEDFDIRDRNESTEVILLVNEVVDLFYTAESSVIGRNPLATLSFFAFGVGSLDSR